MNDNLLTVRDTARALGVSIKTLHRWEKSGRLIPQRTSGSHRRYTEEQILNFKKERPDLDLPPSFKLRIQDFFLLASSRKRFVFSLTAIFLFSVFALGLVGFKIFKDSSHEETTPELAIQPQTPGAVLAETTSRVKLAGNVAFNIPAFFNQLAIFKENVTIENKDLDLGTGELTASNILYSLKTGSGVSVSPGQTPTITNTGVLSLQGSAGALTFTAGSGISISGLTITNSDLGSSQKIFKTIKVGSTSFSADSNTDTLELAAGTGMSISSDTTNKKLTLSGTDIAGFTDDGTVVRLSTSTDSVGIGTTSPSSKFEVAGTAQLKGSSSTTGLYVNSSGNVGIGTTNPSYALDVSGTLNTTGATTLGSTLGVLGATTIAPSSDGTTTALTLRAASGSSGNILNVTNAAGSTSYLSVASDGSLTVGGSTLTNAGLLESSGAIHLTNSANTIVGTAIEGGWTLGSNTFTYRRAMTVTNNSGSSSLPTNYEITVSLSGSTASQIYSKTQTDGDDFRISYYNGSSYSEIARNITTYSSSSIVFTFQLQASIAASGSSSAYYIYYKNSTLSCFSCTYTGNTQLESADTVSDWTSGDDGYSLSQETTIKQEGTGSVKAVAANGNLGTGSTTSQGQLVQALSGHSTVKATISSTDYAYVLGGNNGTSDQTTVYKSTLSSGNIGTFSTTSQGQLPQALSGSSAIQFIQTSGSDTPYALNFQGGGDYAGNSNPASALTISGSFSLEMWIKPTALGGGLIHNNGSGGDPTNYLLQTTSGGEISFGMNFTGSPNWKYHTSSGAGIQTGSWYHIVALYDSSTNKMQVYVNTSGVIDQSGGGGSPKTAGDRSFRIGIYDGSFNGLIDEVRVYNKVLSTTEISNHYNNGLGQYGSAEANLVGAWHLDEGSGTSATDYSGNSTTLTLSGNTAWSSSLITNKFQNLYVLGGINGSTAQSTVYKSTLSGSDLGTFATTSQGQLPQTLYGLSASIFTISSSNYIYVIGGNAGTEASRNVQTTVYKSTIDSSGNVGAFSTTSQTQLSSALYQHGSTIATIGGTNYIYILGGLNSSGTAQTTVYKATVDASANVSAITSTGQSALPQALSQLQALVVTTGSDNYIYAIGGKDSSGNAVSTVYKASLDSSGNVGSWSATGQSALPQALYGHGAFTASSDSTNYVYVLGGQNTAVRDTVYKASINDMSSYTATRTISSTDLSNKNDLRWKYYSSATGSYMALEFSEDASTWQTCSFSVSSASTWETKTCDISGIASASRDGVTRLRFRVTSSQTSTVTSYFDDINGLTNANTISNTLTAASAILGAANLDLNAQGAGAVRLNYDGTSGLAGTGGVKVYDGAAGLVFDLTNSGDASAAGSLVVTGASGSAALKILNGKDFTFQTSVGGDAGLATKMVLTNTGSVGIGTTNPSALLSVGSTSQFQVSSAGAVTAVGVNVGSGLIQGTGGLTVTGTGNINATGTSATNIGNSTGALTLASGGTSAWTNTSGNLTISTATSGTLALTSAGALNLSAGSASTWTLPSSTTALNIASGLMDFDTTNSRVGIGTTAPSAKLDVAGTLAVAGNLTATNTTVVSGTLGNTTGGTCGTQSTSTTLALLQTATSVTSSHILYNSTRSKHARITSVTTCTDGASATWQVITLTDSITSQVSGDFVTVYNPVSDLGTSTAGFFNNLYAINGKFVTSTATGGFDIAEVYPTTDSSIEAGDIVAIKHLEIIKSSTPYQKEIIGIVSTNPGITLGDEKDGNGIYYKKVALVGRVPTKVATTNGPIGVGDYLTSSSIPGVAQKASQPGPIIGKALESFATDGIGKIMVFVNLSWFDPGIYLTSSGNLVRQDTQTLTPNFLTADLESTTAASLQTTPVIESTQAATFSTQIADLTTHLDSLTSRLELLQGMVLLSATSSASSLDNQVLNLKEATLSGTLMVFGRSILSDLGVTGNISAGTLSIRGLEGEINSLAGFLKLQSSGFGGIDILAGKVVIDKEGNIVTQGELTAKKINIDNIDQESASIGRGTIPKGENSVIIKTVAVTSNSRIFVTPTSRTGKQPLLVLEKNPGKGFKVGLEESYGAEITFDWWVVEEK